MLKKQLFFTFLYRVCEYPLLLLGTACSTSLSSAMASRATTGCSRSCVAAWRSGPSTWGPSRPRHVSFPDSAQRGLEPGKDILLGMFPWSVGEHALISLSSLKGVAPLCNTSVWEPRYGGFTWSWGPGWSHRGPVKGRGSTSYHPIPLARPKS